VGFTDLPLAPKPIGSIDFQNQGYYEWEYIPFPPGGGDPWWRMRLRFTTGHRTDYTDDEDNPVMTTVDANSAGDYGARGFIACDGQLELTPDSDPDLFVVIRPDSGFGDVSGLPGDGTGMSFGTDMRAFVEPRSWNPLDGGHWDGGMTFNVASIEPDVRLISQVEEQKYWQDNANSDVVSVTCDGYDGCTVNSFGAPQAWLNERTQTQDNVKPIRCGIDVHDYTLTYSSDNRYARQSHINVGQRLYFEFPLIGGSTGDIFEVPQLPVNLGLITPDTAVTLPQTAFSLWMDPPVNRTSDEIFDTTGRIGILQALGFSATGFAHIDSPGVSADRSNGSEFSPIDTLTEIQYAYETVPFALDPDVGFTNENVPVSKFYTNPAAQPNLPDYLNWSPLQREVAGGPNSFCYLINEGELANQPFRNPTSSGSEATYADDEYVFVCSEVERGNITDVQPNMWLVDRYGGRYRILEVNGDELKIQRGHGAYLDRFFQFPTRAGATEVNLPEWPYGVQIGSDFAVARGAWSIVPDALVRNEYPRQSDWPEGLSSDPAPGEPARAARLLKQHVMQESQPTAVLGFNLAGVADPRVNASGEVTLRSITVAFWGPEFSPNHLNKLDENGELVASGVLLYEDTNGEASGIRGSGVFDGPIFSDLSATPAFRDQIVPLQGGSLQWSSVPEPVDLDGDYKGDDLSGDGLAIYTNADLNNYTAEERAKWDNLYDSAWVLRIQPAGWVLPHTDFNSTLLGIANDKSAAATAELPELKLDFTKPDYWVKAPKIVDFGPLFDLKAAGQKSLGSAGNFGDDLFVVVRTSDEVKSFENFRVVVPARLPNRTSDADKLAGVQLSPRNYVGVSSFEKQSPDEGPVQDFYGHDMLEVSVPTRVTDMTTTLPPNPLAPAISRLITPGGPPFAALGIDASQNRPENVIAAGDTATLQNNAFTTGAFTTTPVAPYYVGGDWTAEAAGLWLIAFSAAEKVENSRIEAYEITAASGKNLTLRAGTPAVDRPWRIVKDPTFLEEVIVELYDRESDGGFDITQDLLPLNFEDPANNQYSGVSVWRDNDDPEAGGTNGVYDAPIFDEDGTFVRYIDLPVRLDDAPNLIGAAGETSYQVRMVFSSPGTDDSTGRNTKPYEEQPLLRQPIPQTFGRAESDADYGSDFFVVLRTSRNMDGADDLQAAIVSWGPDTPTQPDPDNFTVSLSGSETPGQREDEFDLFDEFPHAARGLGFISFFKDPQPIRYWSYDRDKRKTVPRTEVDHSQDNNEVKHWVRSRANVARRTPILVALPSPTVDFTADRHRQIIGGDVKFTLITTGDVEQVLWDFGDGTTDTARDPIHKFAAKGFYDIKVTVRDQYGIEDSEVKEDYIEIVDLPLADFTGTPTDATLLYEEAKSPPIGRDVAFVDLSLGDDNFIPVRWAWNFGDGTSEVTTTKATEAAPLIHRYTQTGFYTVTLETTFTDNATSATVRKIAQIRDYITIRPCVGCPGAEGEGEGEGETDVPAADFSIATEIRDKEAIVPLSDWVPLVNFTMSYGEDDPALRNLQYLRLLLRPDGRAPEDLGYQNIAGPQSSDLLEFGLFFETKDDDDARNNELNIENDFLLYKWNADGGPVGTIEDEGFGFVRYFLDFIGNGTPAEPQFPVPAGPDSDDNISGYSYIIAVRTSANWRSQITMRCDVELARMITPASGSFPVDDEGAPVDSYSPNFYDGEILEEEAAYSSSFDVWSITGTAGGVPGQDQGEGFGVGEYDAWSNGRVLYTPLAEHSRPRWNAPGHLINAVGGEFLELRSLVGLEQWLPVVGINAHSTAPVHIYDGTNGPRTYFENLSQLSEVNLVVTDVGGDPFGPPGNGGFNPMDMLHRESLDTVNSGSNDYAIGSDVTFSGAWVWHDTNNNGLFEPPVGNAEIGGANYAGDRPMNPEYASAWEYVPLPPGGGDPWWKIKLGFFGGTRQVVAGAPAEEGFLEKVPDRINPFAGDSFVGSSEYTLDYFVVLRPDSGTQDSSTLAGDGSGMAPGADFRAFIEPRRFNALSGNYDGGIYLDSMAAPQGFLLTTGEVVDPWQNDARWGTYEPWWPQRTVNANATQKVQSGVEVHDLVMTYETDSPYGVVSNLFFGQGSYTEEHSCLGYSIPGDELTDFDLWMDPLGLLSGQFLNRHTVGVTRVGIEFTANFRLTFGDFVDDALTFALVEDGAQFAFETAPFSNGYDGVLTPRSAAYPLPPSQPTLPEYATWSFDLKPGEYPRASQWADASSKARLLTQKTDIESDVTGILGINLAGTADPFVNRGTPPALRSITVAFWGPDFDPSKLAALDANGETPTAGVTLWEDADKEGFQSSGPFSFGLSTGTFIPPTTMQDYLQFQDGGGLLDLFDKPVTLRNLAWGARPELVDLDGDGVSDDMNGDGVVDATDKAWVLTITPRVAWQVPQNDLYSVLLSEFFLQCPTLSGDKDNLKPGGSFVRERDDNDQKQIDVTGRGAGDDLFVAIRTSDRMSRFEKFRAVVPATLPERAEGQRIGGIQFTTGPAMSLQAAIKSNPEEDPEQDFYGHDMLEVNVPTRILDQTSQSQTIVIGGAATPTLALDLATNLDLTVDSGADGSGAEKTFTVTGKAWTPNAFATAHWLIDSRYEAYQIVANTANQLQLLSGTPRGGKWRIVKDPSFFEQLIVEFYNEGTDAEFNPALDLLPLNLDQQLSGVAIYRDNDNNPANRNGLFDPGIDIPINLDAAPAFVGASGSDMQVKFVFSSPGTDDYAGATRDTSGNLIAGGGVSIAEQARNRQWVPDTFGNTTSDPNSGADFFVVVRAAPNMTPNDNFRMGIVNWGPNTPTEPDPDTWAALSGNERNDFSKFEEFPWASAASASSASSAPPRDATTSTAPRPATRKTTAATTGSAHTPPRSAAPVPSRPSRGHSTRILS
jgi:PKD repeat protein